MRRVARALAAWTLIGSLLAACAPQPAPLAHDAYIWQRQWTPALREAADGSADMLRDWRVLVAQVDADGRFHGFDVDRQALAATRLPVIAVVRIDGRMQQVSDDALLARLGEVARAWPEAAGIEIDYDCPTARLPAYADVLRRVKPVIGGRTLSITALPAWLGSPALDGLLAIPDESVLQVHAVQAPQAGLFDAGIAVSWIDDFARHTGKPFRIALPTYGSRVSWQADGSLLAVESESSTLAASVAADELHVSPVEVRALLDRLDSDRPRGLAGIAWFRLPTRDDTRAWSLATWRGVVTDHLDVQPPDVLLRAGDHPDALADVILRNPGRMDAEAPRVVDLPAACATADGINGYALQRKGGIITLVARQARPLPAGAERTIGWARCSPGTVDTHHPR